jgi:hypothetical protein
MPDKENFLAAFGAMSTEASAVMANVVARIICDTSGATSDTTTMQMQWNTSPIYVAKFNSVSASTTRCH